MHKRIDRVADLLQREIADLIQRRVKDPRVAKVTITGVKVSADLRHAKVYYCSIGLAEERDSVATGLRKASGFIRAQLGRRVRLKHTPELTFFYDTSFDYAEKIDHLLRELHRDD